MGGVSMCPSSSYNLSKGIYRLALTTVTSIPGDILLGKRSNLNARKPVVELVLMVKTVATR
jgi:hypothetical protein